MGCSTITPSPVLERSWVQRALGVFARSWVAFPSKEKRSLHEALELRFTFMPLMYFQGNRESFQGGRYKSFTPKPLSVFGESWDKGPRGKRADGVSLHAEECQLGYLSKKERVKRLRTENSKISYLFF